MNSNQQPEHQILLRNPRILREKTIFPQQLSRFGQWKFSAAAFNRVSLRAAPHAPRSSCFYINSDHPKASSVIAVRVLVTVAFEAVFATALFSSSTATFAELAIAANDNFSANVTPQAMKILFGSFN